MTFYFETTITIYDQKSGKMKPKGHKRIQITRPSPEIADKILHAIPNDVETSDLEATSNQLKKSNETLRRSLPFLYKPSYEDYMHFDTYAKARLYCKYFKDSTDFESLEELTKREAMTCIEHALSIKEVQLHDWNIYKYIPLFLGTSNHIILAKQIPQSPYMMIIDPTAKGITVTIEGKPYIAKKDDFDKKYVKEKLIQK